MSLCGCDGANKYYVGDVGTLFLIDACVDISGAEEVALVVRKPDATEHEWAGTVQDSVKIRYVSKSGDFDQAGEYRLQALVRGLDGWSGRGETIAFRVYDKWA